MRPVAVAVASRLVVVGGDELPPEAFEVVPGTDQLVVALMLGELLAFDAAAPPVGWHGNAGTAGERLALGPDAGVDDADDDARARTRVAAELRPEATGPGEAEELGRDRGGGLGKRVLLEGDDAGRCSQVARLLARQLDSHAVVGDRVVVDLGGTDARQGGIVLRHDVLLPSLHGRRIRVELAPPLRSRGRETGLVAVVAGDRFVRERDEIATVGVAAAVLGSLCAGGQRRAAADGDQ